MNTRKLLVSVLMLVSVLLSACAPATATPPVTTTVPPSAIPATGIPPTMAPASNFTIFSPTTFKLPLSLSYGSDWSIAEYPNQVYLKNKLRTHGWQLAFNLVDGAMIADPNSAAEIPWPQDLVAYLNSNPYIEAGEPKPVTFEGFKGIQIDAYAKYTGDKRSFIRIAGPAEGWLYLDYEEMWRFIVLDDVNGERLVITMITNSVNELSMFADEAQKVLDTVTFSKPAATIFSPKTFNPPITVRYGPEWSIADNYSDVFTLSYAGHDAGVSFMNVKNTKYADGIAFPDDFVTWIQSPDSLFQVEDSKPVLVGGFKGTQINALATCGDNVKWIILSGTGWWCPKGEHMGFIYLDNVNGERVLIEIQGSPGDKDYMFIVEESQKVLDTVVFTKPTVFSPKTFNLITSVNFGSGWHVEEDLLHDLYLDNGQMPIVFNIVTAAQLVDPVGGNLIPFPDDFISWIQSNPDFKTSDATQVTVGGISGMQIDATPITKINKKEFGLTWNILTSDGDWRFILLDNVMGERVLIFMIAPTGKTFSAVPELQQEIQHILDSVVFG